VTDTLTRRVAARYMTAGGQDFEVFMRGTNAKKLFSDAVRDAQYESGSGGYTGTIAEKHGFTMAQSTPVTKNQAQEIMWGSGRWSADRNDKWGDAYCLPIASSKVVMDKDKVVKVKAQNADEAQEKAVAGVKATFKGRKGAVVTIKAKTRANMTTPGGVPEIERTKATDKGYFKVQTRNGSYATTVNSSHTYPSTAAAAKAIKEILTKAEVQPGLEWMIYKVEPKITIKVTKTAAKLPTWEVTVRIIQELMGKVEGYVFYGTASS
jgi:hypothetical protein